MYLAALSFILYGPDLHIPQRIYEKVELRGYCTTNQKLACFVLYLKIFNIFLKTDMCIL